MKSFKIYVLEDITNPDCGSCTKGSCVGCPMDNTTELSVFSGKLTYDKLKEAIDVGNGKFQIGVFPFENSYKILLWTGKNAKTKDAEQWLKNKTSKQIPFEAVFNYDDYSKTLRIDASRSNMAKNFLEIIRKKLSDAFQKEITLK